MQRRVQGSDHVEAAGSSFDQACVLNRRRSRLQGDFDLLG